MIGIGTLVKCVDDSFDPESYSSIPNRPTKGKHYIVRAVREFNVGVGILLEEISNPLLVRNHGLVEPTFRIERFTDEDDIDISELLEVEEMQEA
jgi:hypothetical protein